MLVLLLLGASQAQMTVTQGTEISGKIFDRDSAPSGGSIYHSGSCDTASTLTVTKCVFQASQANSGSGGAIYSVSCGSLSVNECEFVACTASKSGGAVYCTNSPSCTLKGNTVSDGSASKPGGAFYVEAQKVVVEGCTVTKCTGGSEAAAIGIWLDGTPGQSSLTLRSNIIENVMDNVDCVLLPFCNVEINADLTLEVFNCTFDSGGHSVRKFVSFQEFFLGLTITSCHFKNINLLEKGGAFCGPITEDKNSIGELSIVSSTFSKIEGKTGGAIFTGSYFEFIARNCTFTDCHCSNSGAVLTVLAYVGWSTTIDSLNVSRCGDNTGCCIVFDVSQFDSVRLENLGLTVQDCVFSEISGPSAVIYMAGEGHFRNQFVRRLSFIDVTSNDENGLMNIPALELTYDGCTFERAKNSVGSGLLVGSRSAYGNVPSTITANNCTFLDCHCSSGNIIFMFKYTLGITWIVKVTDCRFLKCSSKSEVLSLGTPDTAGGVIKTVEVTHTEIVDCNSEAAIIKLTPSDSYVFESNVVNVSSTNTVISLSVKERTLRLFNCSLGNDASPSSKPFMALNSAAIETVELEECKTVNSALDDADVFLFITPRPTNLNELRISDCVFDRVVLKQASMITQVNTLWINGSSFYRCSSPSGIIHLENQSPDLVISNCIFDGNVHSAGGAGQSIYLEFVKDAAVGSLAISGCTFSNHDGRCPVSIRLTAQVSSVDIQDCCFEGDKVTGASDGLINIAGDGLSYQLSNCTFSRCSIESTTTGVVAISTISPSAAVFSKLNLSYCQFDACSSGKYILLGVTGQNGPVTIEDCSFTNGSVILEFICDALSIQGSTFISDGSASQSVINMSARSDCAFSDSTFIFSGASDNIKYPMISSSSSLGSVVSFRTL